MSVSNSAGHYYKIITTITDTLAAVVAETDGLNL
jgi:hypothetical protein